MSEHVKCHAEASEQKADSLREQVENEDKGDSMRDSFILCVFSEDFISFLFISCLNGTLSRRLSPRHVSPLRLCWYSSLRPPAG